MGITSKTSDELSTSSINGKNISIRLDFPLLYKNLEHNSSIIESIPTLAKA